MVFIKVIKGNPIILDCHKHKEGGEYFRLVIDPDTKEVLEKPEHSDIDVSAAYSRVFGFLLSGEPLPDRLVAEWG